MKNQKNQTKNNHLHKSSLGKKAVGIGTIVAIVLAIALILLYFTGVLPKVWNSMKPFDFAIENFDEDDYVGFADTCPCDVTNEEVTYNNKLYCNFEVSKADCANLVNKYGFVQYEA